MAIKNHEDALAIATQWVHRLEERDLSATEMDELEAWLNASKKNRNAFERAQAVWEETSVAPSELKQVMALAPDPESNFFNDFFGAWISNPRTLTASCVIVFFMISVAVFITPNFKTRHTFTVVETTVGESRDLRLDDGSLLELNTLTKISYNYSPRTRTVHMEMGEVFFDVESNSERPFEINAGGHVVSVIGTSFNVKYIDKALDVSVVNGKVSVAPIGSSSNILLAAGQAALISENGRMLRREVNKNTALAWRSGAIAFENQPLDAILRDLDRYFPEQLSSGPINGNNLYTGLIYIDDLELALEQLSLISATEITIDDAQKIQIKPKEENSTK